jgi:tetratricopeptide (TPR) repeat protein
MVRFPLLLPLLGRKKNEELTQQSKLDKEVATWQEAIRLNPNNADAHYQLGLALYRQDKRKEASTHLQLAKELFNAEGNSQKANQVQGLLWEWGLE